jgi:anti-sigma factor RsiW
MSDQMNTAITDEMLVAYIDRQLDDGEASSINCAIAGSADLQRRIALLESGSRPFADAFESLLGQHPYGLQRNVEQMLASHHSAQSAPSDLWRPDRRAFAASGAIAFLAATLGYWTGRSSAPDMANWREAVAQYHRLYSDQTLEFVADSAPVADEALGRTAHALGLPLSRTALEIPGLIYKRAQLLQIDSTPLVQISFVNARGRPLAFCMRRISGSASLPQSESRAGLSVVHWIQGGFGFMVVADMDPPDLQLLATAFSERVRGVTAS